MKNIILILSLFCTLSCTAQETIVYLTYDDGPCDLTSIMLDSLRERNVKATFFIEGIHLQRNYAALPVMLQDGHAIGNHSNEHRTWPGYNGYEYYLQEVKPMVDSIRTHVGISIDIYRFPYGQVYNDQQTYLELIGYNVYHWDINLRDYDPNRDAENMFNVFVANVQEGQENNVLMHECTQWNTVENNRTLTATMWIIDYCEEHGYKIKILN